MPTLLQDAIVTLAALWAVWVIWRRIGGVFGSRRPRVDDTPKPLKLIRNRDR
jgi:hypothetical protein